MLILKREQIAWNGIPLVYPVVMDRAIMIDRGKESDKAEHPTQTEDELGCKRVTDIMKIA